MMRVSIALMSVAVLLCFAAAPSAWAQGEAKEGRPFSPADIPGNILRGALNFLTSPFEIFRSCSYEASVERSPVYILTGPFYGIGYMVGRAFLGAVDVATLGLTGDRLYGEVFPEYVWLAPWTTANEEPPKD